MPIALLATGDELVNGDVLNTTGQKIAQRLTAEGLTMGLHLTCGDNLTDIIACLNFLSTQADDIIITGGLGPTSDDRTRFALAHVLKMELVEFSEAVFHVEQRLKRANLTMNEGNRQQALFPATAKLYANHFGTAMGCCCVQNNKRFILLPGPPGECLPMFETFTLPMFLKEKRSNKQNIKWLLYGAAEGEIAQKLDEALAHVNCETGYRFETPYVEFKVRCDLENEATIKAIVEPLIKPHLLASPIQKASLCLRNKLSSLTQSIEIIDDATGGLLQTLVVTPETKKNTTFHENNTLRVHFVISGLEEYWNAQSDATTTQITIKYYNDQQCGSETHAFPFLGARVLDYAAEWLSFRLLQLIDQLH